MMLWLGRSIVLLLLVSSAETGPARAKDLSLTIQTRDAVTAQKMTSTSTIQFPQNEGSRKTSENGFYQKWIVPLTDANDGPFIIDITAPNYLDREITIRADAVALTLSKLQRPLRLALAPKTGQYDYEYISNGLNFLNDDTDRALVYYEGPYLQNNWATPDEYGIKLRYDYARALSDACINLGYDTCGEAKRLFEAMNADFSQNQEIYRSSKLNQSLINDALAALKYNEFKVTVQSLTAPLSRVNVGADSVGFVEKQFDAAKQQGADLLHDIASDSTGAYARVGVKLDMVNKDLEYVSSIQKAR
jgi:hypothetical protein